MAKYQHHDAAWRRAKDEGLRSRAALKLREIDGKFRVFRRGARVLDLGCWPGGWLQVAAAAVGGGGRVVGVDLLAVDELEIANVVTLVGDLADEAVCRELLEELGGTADLVLSDMSPSLSGVRAADRARHERLVELAIDVAGRTLSEGGVLVVKLFADISQEITAGLRTDFDKVSRFKPPTTRKGSREIYLVARGYRKPREAAPPGAGTLADERRDTEVQ